MKRAAMGRLGLVALLTSVWLACASSARSYDFQTLNNLGDPNFNALLSINDLGVIAGVYGDGKIVPGHGYTLVPPSAYTSEDFPRATNTNVAGINNHGTTTGFAINPATGAYFGFYKQGNAYTSVIDPLTPAGGNNRLIGVNDANVAVGFYYGSTDSTAIHTISAQPPSLLLVFLRPSTLSPWLPPTSTMRTTCPGCTSARPE